MYLVAALPFALSAGWLLVLGFRLGGLVARQRAIRRAGW